jgi:hypothetical protein
MRSDRTQGNAVNGCTITEEIVRWEASVSDRYETPNNRLNSNSMQKGDAEKYKLKSLSELRSLLDCAFRYV